MIITKKQFAMLICALLFIIPFFCGNGALNARAVASAYSNVLDDLTKDSDFDIEEYPAIKGDYSLQVIQIAESTDGELLVYVYQPGAQAVDYKAKTINIAREPDNSINLSFKSYSLTYQNCTGVFYKYKVNDFKVNSDPARYYNISNILRAWDRYLDMNTDNGNTVSEVPYAVGQYWTVTGTGETVSYHMTTSEIVEIKDKYVGFVNYTDGVNIKWNGMMNGSTDAHFVAFSTNKQIDKLLSVKLEFNEQTINCKYCSNFSHSVTHGYHTYFDIVKSNPEPNEKTITYSEKGGNVGGGNIVHADPYAWYRIRTTSEFLADENNKDYNLTKGTTDNVKSTQWVLSFYETQRYRKTNETDYWQVLNPAGALFVGDLDVRYTTVSDVMLLQLEFETDGQTYKLGVVDNKQTGGNTPGNEPTPNNPLEQAKRNAVISIIVMVAVGVIAVIILICIFVPGAAPAIGKGILTGLWWVISAPVQIIKSIVAAAERRKATAAAKSTTSKKTGKKK
ncbi:MAG: DUF308 domain-containing protein [Clostridia bacterium]|nr:DUF308 domain-containing protein [Clostridia bacterium]